MEKFEYLVPCDCGNHYLRLSKLADEPQVYVDKFVGSPSKSSIWERIKLAFGYVFNPDKYDIHGGVILKTEYARSLGVALLECTRRQFGKENIETGEGQAS